jgi:hypothetical protein
MSARSHRRKGEAITLYCTQCTWSTDLAMTETDESREIPCAHCAAPLYWHCCLQCGLKYVGAQTPQCPICDGSGLDELDDASVD